VIPKLATLLLSAFSIGAVCLTVACLNEPEQAQTGHESLRVAVPPAGLLAPPILQMVKDQSLLDNGIRLERVLWSTPDQLRALIVSDAVDIVGMHMTTAALFDSKGKPIRFLGASLGNVLHILSAQPVQNGLHGLKGKTIAVPMRGEYPDIMLQVLIEKAGLKESIRMQYTATSRDAANQLSAGAVDAALVAEPHVSILMHRLKHIDETSPLYRAIDVQAAWNEVNGTSIPLLTAGFVAIGTCARETDKLNAFWHAYQDAADWCLAHPEEAIALLGDGLSDDIARAGAEQAYAFCARHPVPSGEEKHHLEAYLDLFRQAMPESYAGGVPDDDFYWNPDAQGVSKHE
jgi:NitT/TauT family transport system substrate-binding protein